MAEHVRIFHGNIVHCVKPFELEVIEDGCIVVHCNKIIHVGNDATYKDQRKSYPTADVVRMKKSQLLVPGLIDTHIHGPQYPNAGLGYDKTLLDWLMTYTYPTEALFDDLDYSKMVYNAVVARTLAYGTTTAVYFATMHRESAMELVEAAARNGQRAFVGKVNMIKNSTPNYQEDPYTSYRETEQFVVDVLNMKNNLVQPIITPRFALSVDTSLMLRLSELAERYNLRIQSHISENKDEIEMVQEQYGTSYADAYDTGKMLTRKTIMAHGVHLTEDEIDLLRERGTSVSHCPASNTLLRSGMCDVRKLIDSGVKVGLGTDVSGGASPSIIETMRAAVGVSTHLYFQRPEPEKPECMEYQTEECKEMGLCETVEPEPLTYQDVFYLATLGGAKVVSLEHKIGNFVVDKDFDALLIDMDVKNSSADYLKNCTPLEVLQKFVFLGDDRNVIKVFVAGQKVKDIEPIPEPRII